MLLVPDYTKSSSQLHINYKGATSWNNLPVEMCLIQTYTQFKNMQKKLMQNLLWNNHCYYDIKPAECIVWDFELSRV